MARDNFARSLSAVLKHEGGWADHPRDPGGATMKGVTLATYRRYYPNATKDDLRNISNTDLHRIYRDGYWNVIKGDDLPGGLDYAVFDFAVNSGPSRAARYLQEVLGVTADGKIGPVTLKTVKAADTAQVINSLCDRRMTFLRGLSTFDAFGKGWTRRVSETRSMALQMAGTVTIEVTPSTTPYNTQPKSPAGGAIALVIALLALIGAIFSKAQGLF